MRVKKAALGLSFMAFLAGSAACREDPAVAAQRFVASGDSYVASGRFEAAALEYRNALEHQPGSAATHYKLGLAYEQLKQQDKAYMAFARVTELDASNTDANLRVAITLLASARYEEALYLGRRILAHEPRHVQALAITASAFDGMGKATEARKRIDEALTIDPRSAAALMADASWQMQHGDVKVATDTLRRAVDYDPQSAPAWMALATAEWRLGDVRRTETALQRFAALSPDAAGARRLLASFYVQTGRSSLAEPYLRALAETSSSDKLALADHYLAAQRREAAVPLLGQLVTDKDKGVAARARLRRAVLARSNGASRDAHEEIDLAMKERSAEADARVLKAELLLEEGNVDAALEHARKAAAVNPDSGDAQHTLARIYLARGDLTAAERELKRARDRVSVPAVVDAELARVALSRGDPKAAVVRARQAVAATPTPATYALLSQTLRADGAVNEARRVISSARERWKESVELDTELGYLDLTARRPAQARAAFERAMRTSPTSSASRNGLLLAHIANGRFDSARTSLASWRSESPDDVTLAILSAQLDIAEGKIPQAEQTLQDVIRRAPRNADAVETLAQIYLAAGDRGRALSYYETVAQLRPAPVAALTAIGMLQQASGDRIKAQAAYERAVALTPDAGVAANNLAWLYAEDNRLDDAARVAEQAVKSLAGAPQALDTLGWVYHRQGRSDAAIRYLSQAAAKTPDNPSYHYHLALAYLSAEKRAQARAELERTISIAPESGEAADARRALLTMSPPTSPPH